MFDDIKPATFPEREEEIQKFWEENRIFKKSVDQRQGAADFSFYDGPPFATGLPHYGHLLAGTIKDVVPRYKTMKGYRVPRRFGWDCHGLPVENEIEKTHNLAGAKAIEEYGIEKFNEACRSIVLRYTEEWKAVVQRMGRWVDFSHSYHTMDPSFMESVWWVFKQLYDQGLVYEGFKVMPFSAKLGTPLSNFEASENYKDVDDPSVTLTLPLEDDPNTALLVWTTTPWTLISNLAATVNASIDYVKVHDHNNDKYYILAKDRLAAYYGKTGDHYTIVSSFKGEQLVGKRYQPLFDYFAEHSQDGAFRVIADDFVTTEDGTGVVHTAPAFGEADFYACLHEGIDLVCPVDHNGCFTADIPEYQGMFVKDADKDIIKRLKKEGRVVYQGTIRHRYPFCWRSDTPLIYRAMRTWFVAVEKIKDKIIAANDKIHWTPEHLKYGRFGKWLEGARDWAISRNRYWGTPIPLWRADDGELLAVGSIAELEELTGQKIIDLHRHFIDNMTIVKEGKKFHRIPEVFDCWFESGSMPYAQNHYPFENKENVEATFPADFIAEGLDQTRGWFYTLTVIAAALFDKPAFKNVIVNGILLAENGEKMSKRLKNYPEPEIVINKYGADAVRLYMLHSPAVRADDLRFSERGVELILRQILIPLWNAYSFFVTYAKIYQWTPKEHFAQPEGVIDRWMISRLYNLISDVEEGMDGYNLSQAVEPFVGFVDDLTNWYIRRSRRRFWDERHTPDRDQAFSTLYSVLMELVKVAAPFVPFIAEAIYANLRTTDMPESVHLCDYPVYSEEQRDKKLEDEMEVVQKSVKLGHSLRKKHKLKVRQPLATMHIISGSERTLEFLQHQRHLIAEELNVKEVHFSNQEHDFVNLKVKPNFPVLGRKFGKLMKPLQAAIASLDDDQIITFLDGGNLSIEIEGKKHILSSEDVTIERHVKEGMVAANEGEITVVLETALNDDLVLEGISREIVNKLNTMRREAELHVADRIKVVIDTTDKVKHSFDIHEDYITNEVLATEVSFEECQGQEWDLNGEKALIFIEKV
ncbi:MAG: isoleucine--tRNA ligase [Chlamydiota bacterium]